MSVIRVQKNGQTGFFAQTPYKRSKLAGTNEISLTLGGANENGKSGIDSSRYYCFQRDKIGNIEMTEAGAFLFQPSQNITQSSICRHFCSFALR
jgi:hypothetical protein